MRAGWLLPMMFLWTGCRAALDWGDFRAASPDGAAVDVAGDLPGDAPPRLDVLDAADVIAPDAPLDAPAIDAPADVFDAPTDDFVLVEASIEPPPDAPGDLTRDAAPDAVADVPAVPPEFPPPSPVVQLAMGDHHTCARLDNGSVWCWGDNEWGQLGDRGTSRHRTMPARVELPMGVTAVELTAGGFHTCARLAPTQAVYCWGRNDLRQLGAGMVLGASTVPVPVAGLLPGPWRLSAGVHHTCASIPSVGVYCWGYNAIGQCGQPTAVATVDPPAPVAGTLGFTASAGRSFTCAYGGERVLCWGANDAGQLGVPSFTGASRATAEPIIRATAGEPYVALYVGGFTACARTRSGLTECWGRNDYGQIPGGSSPQRMPVAVTSYAGAELAFGAIHQCALATSDRTSPLRCWGYNALGQAGDGARVTTLGPPAAPALTGAALVAAGFNHTCAALANGVVRCWGALEYGLLGNGASALSPAPSPVPGITNAVGLAAGSDFTCAVLDVAGERRVSCWGHNQVGQLGSLTPAAEPTPQPVRDAVAGGAVLTNVTSVSLGTLHGCARLTNGAVRCWGYNSFGGLGLGMRMDVAYVGAQGTVPLGAPRAEDLAAGANHSCMVRSDNVVSCWGDDRLGQCGQATRTGSQPSPAAVSLAGGAATVAGGFEHTCALGNDGMVRCWGHNQVGQCGQTTGEFTTPGPAVPGPAGPVNGLAVGGSHGCAWLDRGAMRCWGANNRGQLGFDPATAAFSARAQPLALAAVTQVAAGFEHTCALSAAGLHCWGNGQRGQIGAADFRDRSAPTTVAVPARVTFTRLAAGERHTCALASDGGVYCWGSNHVGQLGRSDTFAVTTAAAGGVRWR